jgi:excisionase family DNA binding protein
MRLLTAQDVARILRVPAPRVYALARRGMLPSVRLGRQVRFSEEALARFFEPEIARGDNDSRVPMPELIRQVRRILDMVENDRALVLQALDLAADFPPGDDR